MAVSGLVVTLGREVESASFVAGLSTLDECVDVGAATGRRVPIAVDLPDGDGEAFIDRLRTRAGVESVDVVFVEVIDGCEPAPERAAQERMVER